MELAEQLGYRLSEMKEERARSAGGYSKIYVPKTMGRVEIDVEGGDEWLPLPSLAFAEGTYPLLGRDVIFANFELRMTHEHIDLRWRSDRT
jgi:hypothetical protein